jgi:hypothetical protein
VSHLSRHCTDRSRPYERACHADALNCRCGGDVSGAEVVLVAVPGGFGELIGGRHVRLAATLVVGVSRRRYATAGSPRSILRRLTDRGRTFPAANTPGMLVASSSGRRSSGQPAGGWPAGTGRGRRPGNPARPPPLLLSTFPQPSYPHVCRGLSSVFAQILHRFMHRLLSWQAERLQVSMSQRRKPVISRYTPSCGVGRR